MSLKRFFISLVLSLAFGSAFAKTAQSYECKNGSLAPRKLELNYLAEGKKVPCEVVYTNATGKKTLWSAKTEEGYCEKNQQEFLAKLKSENWTCTEVSAEAAAPIEAKASSPEASPAPAETAPATTPAPQEVQH